VGWLDHHDLELIARRPNEGQIQAGFHSLRAIRRTIFFTTSDSVATWMLQQASLEKKRQKSFHGIGSHLRLMRTTTGLATALYSVTSTWTSARPLLLDYSDSGVTPAWMPRMWLARRLSGTWGNPQRQRRRKEDEIELLSFGSYLLS
jgi:hypothetical protein